MSERRLARRLVYILAGAILLVATAVAGFVVSALLAPEALRAEAERLLEEQIGPARVGSVRLVFSWGLALEASSIRTEPLPEGAGFGAERATLSLRLRSLLRGEPQLRSLSVEGAWAHLVRTHDGRWSPAAVDRASHTMREGQAQPEQEAADGAAVRALATLRRLLPSSGAPPSISIHDARVEVSQLGSDGERAAHFAIQDLDLRLARPPLRRRLDLSGSGRLTGEGSDRGGFAVHGEVPDDGPARIELALVDVELEATEPWLARAGLVLDLEGRASAHLSWSPGADEASEIEAELIFFDLAAHARLTGTRRTGGKIGSARLRSRLLWTPERLSVRGLRFTAGGFQARGGITLGLPAGPLAIDLRGGTLPVEAVRTVALGVSEGEAARQVAASLLGGTVDSFSLTAPSMSMRRWRRFLADPIHAWPRRGSLAFEVSDVEIAIAGEEPLSGVGAQFELGHDHLVVRNGRAMHGDRPLPGTDLDVRGLQAILSGLDPAIQPEPVPPLPGRLAWDDWLESLRTPGAPPRWNWIDMRADWIDHPVVLRPLEGVVARFRPLNPGVAVELDDAYWNGVQLAGNGEFVGGSSGRMRLELTAATPAGPLPERDRSADPGVWARGTLASSVTRFGPFRASQVEGRFRAHGHFLDGEEMTATLEPVGEMAGAVRLDLSRRDEVPYTARFQLADGSLSEMMYDLNMAGDSATGTVLAAADLDGTLIPHVPVLSTAAGPVSIGLRNGEIRRRLPLAFAIAAASDTFNPFRSRDILEYGGIDGLFHLEDSLLSTESVSLKGSSVRLVATGSVDVVDPDHRVEAVAGLFFFRGLDVVIGALPLLNTFLLGSDDNLVSAYFSVTGPWLDPDASLITSKSIAKGPASFMIEGVPSFVRAGLSTLQRLFVFKRPDEERRTEATP